MCQNTQINQPLHFSVYIRTFLQRNDVRNQNQNAFIDTVWVVSVIGI